MNSLIITGGCINLPFAKKYMNSRNWDYVISADSGMEFLKAVEVIPDLILGDYDSAKPETLAYFQEKCPDHILRFPSEKDETDTELAIMYAIQAGAEEITILGGTGTRLDHVLGNIHLLQMALGDGVLCSIVDEHNRIRMIRETTQIRKDQQFGDYVSLIPFTPEVEGLTLKGFYYGVEDFTLTSGKARGVSNEIVDEVAEISMKSGILLVIESRD